MFLPALSEEANPCGMLYVVAGKKIKKQLGPRLTAGWYGLISKRDSQGSKAGPVLGYEQPLGDKFMILADWYGGQNQVGYVSAGFGVSVTKNSTLYASYNLGNQGRGNNWLGIYYGFVF